MKLQSLFLSCVLLAAPAAAMPEPTAELTFEFGETTVEVGGVQPGAEVLVYTLARTVNHGITIVTDDTYRLSDADGDGAVVLELEEEVPLRSLWIAFDLASGAHAVEQASIGVREVDFAERGSLSGARLEYRLAFIYAFMARARVGGWRLRAGDGGPSDFDDDHDGKITLHPARMNALADSPPPPGALAAQDLVVVIDPRRMIYAVVPQED